MSGLDELREIINRVARLPELGRIAAPDVADAVEGVLERQIKASTDPYGKPWAPKKEGSGKPLANAGRALYVGVVGTRILATVKGPEARHSKGTARGGERRQILPDSDIPPDMVKAVKPVLIEHFKGIVGGSE